MKISEIKNIYEQRVVFYINNKTTYLRVIELLMKNGFNWSYAINESVYERYFKNEHIRICCNYYKIKILLYSNSINRENDILIDEYNFNSLYLYFNPIPDYKPKKFIREI